MVERRAGPQDAFGQGKKEAMAFEDFVRQLQQGSECLYMTTQEVGKGVEFKELVELNCRDTCHCASHAMGWSYSTPAPQPPCTHDPTLPLP